MTGSTERSEPSHEQRPLIEIGYWPTVLDHERPDPARFVDPDWSPEARDAVIGYLASGSPLPWEQGPVEWCSFCEAILVVDELTDGTYVWPTGLIHYVREHSVRLPGSFVSHVLREPQQERDHAAIEHVDRQHDAEWWNALTGP